jgi:hypothetical protein
MTLRTPQSGRRERPPIHPTQLPLLGQVVRLSLHLLQDVRTAELRFSERERLRRLLTRLSAGIAATQAELTRSQSDKRTERPPVAQSRKRPPVP